MIDKSKFSSFIPETTDEGKPSFARSVLRAADERYSGQSFITKNQVSGWKFIVRRIMSGITTGDSRMLVDPAKEQSKPLIMGTLLTVTAVIGCFMFTFLKPHGHIGQRLIYSDRTSKALYVRANGLMHPVFNLTSAQLIAGKNETPTEVNSSAIDEQKIGNLLGIPSAPGRMVQNFANADWSVCQTSQPQQNLHITVLGQTQEKTPDDGNLTSPYIFRTNPSQAILTVVNNQQWIVWGNQRSLIQGNVPVISQYFNLEQAPIYPMDSKIFNIIPRGGDITLPQISNGGSVPHYERRSSLDHPLTIGSIIEQKTRKQQSLYYVVLETGIEPISLTAAEVMMLHNLDTTHSEKIRTDISSEEISTLPRTHTLDFSGFPTQPIHFINPQQQPTLCVRWQKSHNNTPALSSILVGSSLPIPSHWKEHDLVKDSTSEGADSTVMPPNGGYLAQLTGMHPYSPREESLMWISESGVSYPIPGALDDRNENLKALGLRGPTTFIPESIAVLLPAGPELSRTNAAHEYDVITSAKMPSNR